MGTCSHCGALRKESEGPPDPLISAARTRKHVLDIKDPLRFKNMQQLRESYNPQLSPNEQYNLELMRLEQSQRIDSIIAQTKVNH